MFLVANAAARVLDSLSCSLSRVILPIPMTLCLLLTSAVLLLALALAPAAAAAVWEDEDPLAALNWLYDGE